MRTITIRQVLQEVRKTKNNFVKGILYTLTRLFKRPLKLDFIFIPDLIVFAGNYFVLQWEVNGCYKIVVNDVIILPGMEKSVVLHSAIVPKPLTVRFYGYKEIVEKMIEVDLVHLSLEKRFQLQVAKGCFEYKAKAIPLKRFAVNRLTYKNNFLPVIPLFSVKHIIPVPRAVNVFFSKAVFPDPQITIDDYIPEQLTT